MTDAAVGRRERKKEETKRRIFVAALELFHEKGFESTTVDEITERADVAKGTFFNYFPRKESVLEFLSEEWMERAREHVSKHGRSAREKILAVFGGMAEAYGEDHALARMVIRVSMERMCCPEPEAARTEGQRIVTEAVRGGQLQGELRSDLDPASVFGVLASVFMGSLMWWVSEWDETERPTISLHDAVEHQLAIVFDGIAAIPARTGRA